MRFSQALALILAILFAVAAAGLVSVPLAWAQDVAPVDSNGNGVVHPIGRLNHGKVRAVKRATSDAAGRAFARAAEVAEAEDWTVARVTCLPALDASGEKTVAALVEFQNVAGSSTGQLGVFLGARAEGESDQWILIPNQHLKSLQEAAERVR